MNMTETFSTKIIFRGFSHSSDTSMYIFPYLCVVFSPFIAKDGLGFQGGLQK